MRPTKVKVDSFLKKLRTSAKRHTRGYVHYTNMKSLVLMIASGRVYLSAPSKTNDGTEVGRINRRTYMMSFSFSTEENIAMWSVYGAHFRDAIRLTFSHGSIMEWLSDVARGEIAFYGASSDGRKKLKPLKVKPSCVELRDVSYNSKKGCCLSYRNRLFTLIDEVGNVVKTFDTNPRLGTYVKTWPWFYEQEVRIVVEFAEELKDDNGCRFERIAADFEGPLTGLAFEPSEIMIGPWCHRKMNIQIPQLANVKVRYSDFNGKLGLREKCERCPYLKKGR